MNETTLQATAHALVASGCGILAADESAGTCEKRFSAVGIASTEENRRRYRQILITTPAVEETLSGIILFEETFWQRTDSGEAFTHYLSQRDVLPGIKLDQGLQDLSGFPNEKVSAGLDTLVQRIEPFARAGARFAKWRSVISVDSDLPSDTCLEANAYVLARYARICQDFDIVPIVEPEVLYDGAHTLAQCEEAMQRTYDALFAAMDRYRVSVTGTILKTSMVLPGKDSGIPMNHQAVAEATVRTLHNHVPGDLGGVVFLSGGQTPKDSLLNLNRIAKLGQHPWGVTFSFSRGIQDPVLKAWAKNPSDSGPAQVVYTDMLAKAVAARDGVLNEDDQIDSFVSRSQDL